MRLNSFVDGIIETEVGQVNARLKKLSFGKISSFVSAIASFDRVRSNFAVGQNELSSDGTGSTKRNSIK